MIRTCVCVCVFLVQAFGRGGVCSINIIRSIILIRVLVSKQRLVEEEWGLPAGCRRSWQWCSYPTWFMVSTTPSADKSLLVIQIIDFESSTNRPSACLGVASRVYASTNLKRAVDRLYRYCIRRKRAGPLDYSIVVVVVYIPYIYHTTSFTPDRSLTGNFILFQGSVFYSPQFASIFFLLYSYDRRTTIRCWTNL